MVGDSLRREARHAVRPEKTKTKSPEHEEQEEGIDETNVPVGIAETKPRIEVTHQL
jgi:hypothetical protein